MRKNYYKTILTPTFIFFFGSVFAQQPVDSVQLEKTSIHAQTTVITQYKPAFSAKYTGKNSLLPTEESQTSITSTIFAGARLWKGASVFINPEIAGGSGLSGALGVAASTNGETYRVGNPEPTIYLARLFFHQEIMLGNKSEYQATDQNQLAGKHPDKYFAFTIGKIDVADYFDANSYSHDPRTQFLSWGLMSNGAWDYPANVRGYTPSIVLEYVAPHNEIRYAASLVPLEANGSDMNWHVNQASSHTLEYTRKYKAKKNKGALRLLGFFTTANMGNYLQSIALDPEAPDITATRKFGNTKYGFGINWEQELNSFVGAFVRASWNDGKNETWMFTEIDRSASAGLSFKGKKWKRPDDGAGIAIVASGLSQAHEAYLEDGGYGFILGDSKLNYMPEQLGEAYYSFSLLKNNIVLSGVYQLVLNPGYNKDRGPVNVFSLRVHAEI